MEQTVLDGILCADEETLTKYLRAALQRRKEFLQGGDILYHELTKEQVAHISEISKYAQEICENEKELQVV